MNGLTQEKSHSNVLYVKNLLLTQVTYESTRDLVKAKMFELTIADFALNLLQEDITVKCMRDLTLNPMNLRKCQ